MTFTRTALIGTLLASSVNAGLAQDAALVERGETVFEHECAPCHGPGVGTDGAPLLPGTYALEIKYGDAKPALLTERTDLPLEVLTSFVRNGVASMPPFRKTEVTDEDLEAVAAYLENAE